MGVECHTGLFCDCPSCSTVLDFHHATGRVTVPDRSCDPHAAMMMDASVTMHSNEGNSIAARVAEGDSPTGFAVSDIYFDAQTNLEVANGKFKIDEPEEGGDNHNDLHCSRPVCRLAPPGTAAVGIGGCVCPHGVPVRKSFINMLSPESWSIYMAILYYAIVRNSIDAIRWIYLDFGCQFQVAFYRYFADPTVFVSDIAAGAIHFFVDWLHAKGHRPWCRFTNGAMYVAQTGRRIGAQCEELWAKVSFFDWSECPAYVEIIIPSPLSYLSHSPTHPIQMKRNARLWQCMTPSHRLESMSRFLQHVAKSLEVCHFGALVKKNWATIRKIKDLSKVRRACVVEASNLGVNESELMRASTALKLQLQSQGRAASGGGPSSSGVDNDLIEFVILAIQARLLSGVEQMHYAALFFCDLSAISAISLAIKKAEEKKACLLVHAFVSLQRLGYSSADHRWLALESFKGIVESARQREMGVRASEIERLVEEYDHCSAEILRLSINESLLTKLRKLKTALRKKIVSRMKLYLWWASFSATDGCASHGWDTTAAVVDELLKVTASDSTRVFPWDPTVSGGTKQLPRRVVLKFLNTVEELARSIEEWTTFLPSSLVRAIRYLAFCV